MHMDWDMISLIRIAMNIVPVFFLFVAPATSAFSAALGGSSNSTTTTTTTTTTPQGFTLIMKNTILSAPRNLTMSQIHEKLFKISKHRANHLMSLLPNTSNSTSSTGTTRASISHALSAFFYGEFNIGTPPFKVNLVLDTGSTTTWTQSAQCKVCFPVSVPNFNPKNSSTYQRMHRTHPLCVSTGELSGQFCSYEEEYIDGEITKGDFGFDAFTFKSQNDGNTGSRLQRQFKIPNVAFGSGIYNSNITDFENDTANPISGVFGIGKDDPSSILLQLKAITSLKFSYCLPQLFGHHDYNALLHFGNDANIRGPGVQTTPICGHGFYGIMLNSIYFNGRQVSDKFRVVVDSGSPYTFLVKEAYNPLQQAVTDYFLEVYGWIALEKSRSGFGLCYSINMHHGGEFAFPKIKLHFQGGAKLELNKVTTFQAFEQVEEFCMMILPSPYGNLNILGAFQQVNHRWFFDVGASKLSFAPENC